MRYFLKLSYLGKNYNGWQIQPNAPSVQAEIEQALSKILRTPIEIIGCGRTDTGVHASEYYAHFDIENDLPTYFLSSLNKLLPNDIAIHRVIAVTDDAHTRFDATRRSYQYHLTGEKNPFQTDIATPIFNFDVLDKEAMQAAAAVLLEYKEFMPFCKSNHDAKTLRCDIYRSEWEWDLENKKAIYHISANRFLRGMVRLIVGMCLKIGEGKMTLEELRDALDKQILLKRATSAKPQGLFLTEVKYPFL
jgi:tRNA pseudouridine38-40 synthase